MQTKKSLFSLRNLPLILGLLLTVIVFLVFQRVFQHDFVDWDDDWNIMANPYLNPVSMSSIPQFWHAPYNFLYTPVTDSIWAVAALAAWSKEPILRQSGGWTNLAPDIFHELGLLVHLANVLLVFTLLRRIVRQDIPAAVGALFFGIHPMQVEVVAWVTGMNNTLAALFGLIALLFYTRWAQAEIRRAVTLNSVVATLAYTLALLSKPTATALPLVALVLELGLFRRKPREFTPIIFLWIALAGMTVLDGVMHSRVFYQATL